MLARPEFEAFDRRRSRLWRWLDHRADPHPGERARRSPVGLAIRLMVTRCLALELGENFRRGMLRILPRSEYER